MRPIQGDAMQILFFLPPLLFLGLIVYLIVPIVKPRGPAMDAPAPAGFHARPRMSLQEFYEAYYLKPGSPIRLNDVQQGLVMFSMEARAPKELLRPTDRLSDFGPRSQNVFSSIVAVQLQQAIARNPQMAGAKLESLDDLIQLVAKLEAEQPGA